MTYLRWASIPLINMYKGSLFPIIYWAQASYTVYIRPVLSLHFTHQITFLIWSSTFLSLHVRVISLNQPYHPHLKLLTHASLHEFLPEAQLEVRRWSLQDFFESLRDIPGRLLGVPPYSSVLGVNAFSAFDDFSLTAVPNNLHFHHHVFTIYQPWNPQPARPQTQRRKSAVSAVSKITRNHWSLSHVHICSIHIVFDRGCPWQSPNLTARTVATPSYIPVGTGSIAECLNLAR